MAPGTTWSLLPNYLSLCLTCLFQLLLLSFTFVSDVLSLVSTWSLLCPIYLTVYKHVQKCNSQDTKAVCSQLHSYSNGRSDCNSLPTHQCSAGTLLWYMHFYSCSHHYYIPSSKHLLQSLAFLEGAHFNPVPKDLNSLYSRHSPKQETEVNTGGPNEHDTFISMAPLPNICYSWYTSNQW